MAPKYPIRFMPDAVAADDGTLPSSGSVAQWGPEGAEWASASGGLPQQWSKGTNGDVIATVDDGSKTPLTLQSIDGQTGNIVAITSATTAASVTDTSNQLLYRGRSFFGYPSSDNNVAVTLVNNGPSLPLTATGNFPNLVVQLATDGGGNVISTVNDVFQLLNLPQAPNDLVRAFTTGGTVLTDIALVGGPWNLIGGLDPGTVVVHPGGNVEMQTGDPHRAALKVVADNIAQDVQATDIFSATCNGYGIYVNKFGTLIMSNDETNSSAQFYVNDGGDLALEVDGVGDVYFRLAGRGPVLRSPNGTLYRLVVDNAGVLSTVAV